MSNSRTAWTAELVSRDVDLPAAADECQNGWPMMKLFLLFLFLINALLAADSTPPACLRAEGFLGPPPDPPSYELVLTNACPNPVVTVGVLLTWGYADSTTTEEGFLHDEFNLVGLPKAFNTALQSRPDIGPIMPGTSRTITQPTLRSPAGNTPIMLRVRLTLVSYLDGTVTGESDGLKQLLNLRMGELKAYEHWEAAIAQVSNIESAKKTAKAMEESADESAVASEYREAYESAKMNLIRMLSSGAATAIDEAEGAAKADVAKQYSSSRIQTLQACIAKMKEALNR